MSVLPDSIKYVEGDQQIVFRDVTDFGPATNVDLRQGTPTACQLDLTSVANSAARQSDKVDLGANRAPAYEVLAAFELAATPTAGSVIELWWAPSSSGTAAKGNPGGVAGADGAYAGYSSNLADSINQCQFIGDFVCTVQATATIQIGRVGTLIPRFRYGTLVVRNLSGAAFHSDAVESHVVFQPILPQVQD